MADCELDAWARFLKSPTNASNALRSGWDAPSAGSASCLANSLLTPPDILGSLLASSIATFCRAAGLVAIKWALGRVTLTPPPGPAAVLTSGESLATCSKTPASVGDKRARTL